MPHSPAVVFVAHKLQQIHTAQQDRKGEKPSCEDMLYLSPAQQVQQHDTVKHGSCSTAGMC